MRVFRVSFGERGVRRDVASEIAFHIEMRTRELVASGMSLERARAEAIAVFGDPALIEAAVRSERRRVVRRRDWRDRINSIGQDIKYAVRTLHRAPGFTAAVLVTLALGIGVNTAIFSMVNGVLLRRLPYAHGDRLVTLEHPVRSLAINDIGFSPTEAADLRASLSSLDGLAEYHSMSFDLLGHGEPRRVQTGVVSADFFDLIGVRPLLGRTFIRGEDHDGAPPVLVLSYRFWMTALGGDSAIVGQTFTMNDRQHLVIGVLPPLPAYPDRNDVWMPVSSCPFRSRPRVKSDRAARMVAIIGRVAQGRGPTDAQREAAALETRWHTAYPDAYSPAIKDAAVKVTPLRASMTQSAAPAFLVLLAVAGLVLLVACINVAHLTLARHLGRQRELAIRTALGAGRRRLLRQLLTESVLLSLAGGAIGLVGAAGVVGALARYTARFTPRAEEIVLDWRVAAFTFAIAAIAGVAFGVIPVFAQGRDVVSRLRDGGATTSGNARVRLRGLLVIGEVALAFVILIGAGLMIRSFARLVTTSPGYDLQNVVTARVDLNFTKYSKAEPIRRFTDDVIERLSSNGSVKAVAIATEFPASSSNAQNLSTFVVRGREVADSSRLPKAEISIVSQGYFGALGVPIVGGRAFGPADRDTAVPVAMISLAAARKYFAGGDAVGRQISLDGHQWATVIGVAGDVRQFGPASDVPEQIYLPLTLATTRDLRVLVRSGAGAAATSTLIRQIVHAVDPNQPVTDVVTLEDARRDAIASPRLTTALLTAFAILALVIAAAGLGGVIAYSVGQRTQEFGIRMALGAERQAILALVVRQGVGLAAIGVLLGALVARSTAHSLTGLLYGVQPTDAITYLGVAAVFIVVALIACVVPARRATAIDPAATIRAS
ncbi:MAG TPA: ABC transporter permease [Gemmatimonadaceae bacterium]|jgi:putative ABC transport system permease protein|nr:ABC transporter permease [Gemmatimonadaceae bacterium]